MIVNIIVKYYKHKGPGKNLLSHAICAVNAIFCRYFLKTFFGKSLLWMTIKCWLLVIGRTQRTIVTHILIRRWFLCEGIAFITWNDCLTVIWWLYACDSITEIYTHNRPATATKNISVKTNDLLFTHRAVRWVLNASNKLWENDLKGFSSDDNLDDEHDLNNIFLIIVIMIEGGNWIL